MTFQNKTFLVYGMGKTGNSVAKLIAKNGGKVAFYDREKTDIKKELAELEIESRCGEKKSQMLIGVDVVVLSPGVSIHSEIVLEAIRKNICVISEMDLSLSCLLGTKIGITASNGKSTTTKMVYEMLKRRYKDVRIGGNYGTPICELCENSSPQTISVLEVSSFMLEQSRTFHFDVAVLSNISKNHLDRHKTMKKYRHTKCKISKNMDSCDLLVIPENQEELKRELSSHFKIYHAPKIEYFATASEQSQCKNQTKKNTLKVAGEDVMSLQKFTLEGLHNRENLLVSAIVAKHFGVENSEIQTVAENFLPLPHRFQVVERRDGITYINDSKSTNASAGETTLAMINFPTVILLGGSEKRDDFSQLLTKIKNNKWITKAIFYGEISKKLERESKSVGYHNHQTAENFRSAVEMGKSLCVEGSTLLLSPSAPSFDEFKNFEQRGEEFVRLIKRGGKE